MTRLRASLLPLALLSFCLLQTANAAESCYTTQDPDFDAATRAAIETAAQQLFSDAAAGNVAAMQQSAISGINFQGIANTVTANKAKLAGGQAHIRNEWLLDAPGTQ